MKATLLGKRKELGLDRPAVNQYFGWLWDLVSGNPGKSYVNGVRIWSFMGERVKVIERGSTVEPGSKPQITKPALATALPLAHNLPRKAGISGRLSSPNDRRA